MRIALCLACAVFAVGCDESASPGEAPRSAASLSETEQLSCSRQEVEELVRSFLDAFNAGDLTKLDRLVALEPEFRWYSVDAPGEGLERDSYDRSTLIATSRSVTSSASPDPAALPVQRLRPGLRTLRIPANSVCNLASIDEL